MNGNMLVVLSGGQDSTTCLYWALRQVEGNRNRIRAITFDYNQRHKREVVAACQIANRAHVHHELLVVGPILAGKSPLTNHNEKLETYSNFEEMDKIIGDRVELTFVPMRNALFLCLAANRAAVHGCDYIVTGVCQADNANYPDCRATFVEAMTTMIQQALGDEKIRILAPLLNATKAQSIQLALSIPGCYHALAFTHTAYSGEYPPSTKDHASVLRAHGFEEAGVPDPLILRAWWEQRMPLPLGSNYDVVRGMDPNQYHFEQIMHQLESELSHDR